MTNLEALESLIEYRENDDRFTKALLDQSVNPYDTYSAANQASVDLAAIDIIDFLLAHPEFKEGDTTIKYDVGALSQLSAKLRAKYNTEQYNISGKQLW